jgi:hypothetical protein
MFALVKNGFSYADLRDMDEAEFYAFADILLSIRSGGSKKKTYLPANET